MSPADHLRAAQTIAVVGCSDRPTRTSHQIARYLQDAGYTIVPVNPKIEAALGLTSYPDLAAVPAGVRIDIVNIFRRPSAAAAVVEDAVARAARQEQGLVVWPQLGVHTPAAEAAATAADLPYVKGQCIRVVHQRQLG